MKTFRHILSYLQAALLIGLTAACHDDIQSPNNSPDVDFATGITLRIPNLSRAADFARTRAESETGGQDANIIKEEGQILNDDLHLYIFPTAETGGNPIHVQLGDKKTFGNAYQDLPCLDENGNKKYAGIITTESNTETYYHIPMIPGKYRLYVLGNLKKYNSSLVLDNKLKENDIKNITLKFDGPLKAGELPMLCLPEDVDGTTNGEFDVLQKDLTSLACNLRFQCAKVRYTVLFDNTPAEGSTEAGFSNPQFGANHFLDFTGATVSNIASGINLDTKKEYSENPLSDSEEITLTASEWPAGDPFDKYNAEGTAYPGTGTNDKGVATPGLKAHNGNWTDNDRRRAWQGIVYLPENKKTDARTTLKLAGLVDGTSDNPYEVPLIKDPTGTKTSTLDRGKFYDLTLLATSLQTTELKFVIQDFTTQQLIYDLHGPNFLYIDKTTVNVESGEPSYITYETNVRELKYKSAVYRRNNGDGTYEEIPIYDFKEVNGKIEITVNSKLSADECKEITDATNNASNPSNEYNYFHIQAGNINKKVTVFPLSLDPFLTVEPEEITINVREQLSSGHYDNINEPFPITVKTNFDNYTITAIKWDELGVSGNTSDLLYLAYKDANNQYVKVNFNSEIEKPESGRHEYYLIYTGLNDGNTFWSDKDHELTLTFTPEGKTDKAKTVKIKTQRSSDNYIIYFKAPSDWKNPHIYVYQCLEFPGNHHYTKTFYGKQYDIAGMPIGYYKTNDDGNITGSWAALEYCFTGKIAFKGWDYSINKSALDLTKNYTYTCGYTQGFFVFDDGMGNDKNSWNASEPLSDDRYHKDMDFCSAWREELRDVCDKCSNSSYNPLWPGIAMIKDGDWYRFELTNVATPGKALIMFTDLHDRNEGSELADDWNSRRYPEANQVGIPLFDYPDKTGYFNLADGKKYFTNTPDGTQNDVQSKKYVIYYEDVAGWTTPHAYCWEGSNQNAQFPGVPMTKVSGNIWKYETDIKYTGLILNKGERAGQSENLSFQSGYKYKWNGSSWDITKYN